MFKFLEEHFARTKEKKEMKDAIASLVEESKLTPKFIIFTILSAMIAALGVMMDNAAVLIGAMLIAPLLIPVISLSVGIGAGSLRLINHSIKSLAIGFALAVLSATLIAWGIGPTDINHTLYESFSDATMYSMVAILAGIIAVYSWFKPGTDQIIPGVAIAVALIPPVAFAGTVIIINDQTVLIDILQLLFLNLAGIFLGGLLTFILFAIFSRRPTLEVGKQVDTEVEKKAKE